MYVSGTWRLPLSAAARLILFVKKKFKKCCERSIDVFLRVGLAFKLFSTRCTCQEFLIYDSAVHLADRPRVNINPPRPQSGSEGVTSSRRDQQGAAAASSIKELGSRLRLLGGFFPTTRVMRDRISFFSCWSNFIGSMVICQRGGGIKPELFSR